MVGKSNLLIRDDHFFTLVYLLGALKDKGHPHILTKSTPHGYKADPATNTTPIALNSASRDDHTNHIINDQLHPPTLTIAMIMIRLK
jgi:hypothetical protein